MPVPGHTQVSARHCAELSNTSLAPTQSPAAARQAGDHMNALCSPLPCQIWAWRCVSWVSQWDVSQHDASRALTSAYSAHPQLHRSSGEAVEWWRSPVGGSRLDEGHLAHFQLPGRAPPTCRTERQQIAALSPKFRGWCVTRRETGHTIAEVQTLRLSSSFHRC